MTLRLLLIFSLSILLGACSSPNSGVAGTATDAENTVAGVVYDSLGSPLQNVQVSMVPDSLGFYSLNPVLAKSAAGSVAEPKIQTVRTDSKGRYSFPEVASNIHFSLHYSYQYENGSSFVRLIPALDRSSAQSAKQVQHAELDPASSLSGVLEYIRGTDSRYQFSNHFLVTIKGTGEVYSIYAGEPFVIDGLPTGEQTILVYPADEGMVKLLMSEGLPMDSMVTTLNLDLPRGDTLELSGFLTWSLPKAYLGEDVVTPPAKSRVVRGVVMSYLGTPVENAEVHMVLDSFGFSYAAQLPAGDSLVARTNAKGEWVLPLPIAARFNLEFFKYNAQDSIVGIGSLLGIRNLVEAETLLVVDTVTLQSPARIAGMLRYTEEPNAWVQVGSHFRVGIKGTTRYVDVIAGEPFVLEALPSGTQTLVYYPGDSFLWETFESRLGKVEDMVGATEFVVLSPGITLNLQVDTYTLPALPE